MSKCCEMCNLGIETLCTEFGGSAFNPFQQLVTVALRGEVGRTPLEREAFDDSPIEPLSPPPAKGRVSPALVGLLEQHHPRPLSSHQLAAAAGMKGTKDLWGILKGPKAAGRVTVAGGLWRINPDWRPEKKES